MHMRELAVLGFFLLLIGGAAAAPKVPNISAAWDKWKRDYNKHYSGVEEMKRSAIFGSNLHRIALWNFQKKTPKLALNQYADMTSEEIDRVIETVSTVPTDNESNFVISRQTLPARFDWRDQGLVTEVKNQGSCGGCWAFSAIAASESAHAIAGHPLTSFSEQQLIDCSKGVNRGCNGGDPRSALDYIVKNGLAMEKDYPFRAGERACHYNNQRQAGRFSSVQRIKSGDETALAYAVWQNGPAAVAIDATQFEWQFYSNGVLYEPNCNPTRLTHGVTVVGFTEDAWIVKNTWGPTWGNGGYIYMARNRNNNCGIATYAATIKSA